jgi:phosphoribosylformylglycinamidine cyclo-ligase
VPPIVELVRERGGVSEPEAWEVFNMGCGFVAIVPDAEADAAAALLAEHHPGSRRIGTVTGAPGRVSAPGVSGDRDGLRAV